MKFRAHETFFIRKGWLFKGLKNVFLDNNVFIRKDKNPFDIIGIGSNMVKSLRYWLQATKLTTEDSQKRVKPQNITDLGKIVFNNDRYFEEIGSLCLIHYMLATNVDNATSWYYFFNDFNISEFQKEDFVLSLQNYVQMKGGFKVAQKSLEDDFNCIINSYVSRKKLNPTRVNPESNIECPLDELGLIELISSNKNRDRTYKKASIKTGLIPPYILLALIKYANKDKKEIRISALLNEIENIGKIFNYDVINLFKDLDILAATGLIDVVRTAGLDLLKIKTDKSFYELIQDYYDSLNGK